MNRDEVIKIKIKIMKDALKGKIKYPALTLSFVDILHSLKQNEKLDVYTSSEQLTQACKYVFGENRLVDAKNFLLFVHNAPTQVYVYIGVERDEDIGQFLSVVDSKANEGLNNVLCVLNTPNVNESKYHILWYPKVMGQNVPRFYERFYTSIGEGWGDLEGKEEALKTKVTQELYDLWASNIVEIEDKKTKMAEDYLLQQQNENKQQKTN